MSVNRQPKVNNKVVSIDAGLIVDAPVVIQQNRGETTVE